MAELKIFSGNSSKKLAEKVCSLLGIKMSPLEIKVFSDGEKRFRIGESVVDRDCVVFQSTCPPVDENYMELFFIIDGLKRSGAKSITLVMPYFGYQRQDHVFREGEAVSLDVVVKIVESLGVDRVISFDLHSIKIPELFNIPFAHLSALSLFAEKINKDNASLVSPDMGGIRRIKMLSEITGLPYAVIQKDRDLETGKVEAVKIEGEIHKNAFIVDDIIASGKTIVVASDLLRQNGAESVSVLATHAVLSGNAVSDLQKSSVDRVIVSDTIDTEDKSFEKLEVISIADLIAKELKK